MRRFALIAATVAALAAATADAKEWTKIRIGVEGAYAPFSIVTPEGKLAGFDIDIANALCAEIKAQCELIQQDWDGIIPALLAKKYDAIIASMTITDERKKTVDFTNKYYQTPARFIRKKGSAVEISEAGLKGKRVGVQRATTHDTYLTDNFAGAAEIVRYATQDEANLDLVTGRLDLVLADSVVLDEGFLKTADGAAFEFVGPELRDTKWFGYGAGIAVRKQDDDLEALLNKAIAAIRTNGTYDAIAKKYFAFDVYGS